MGMHEIIIKPLVTEKGTHQAQTLRAYPFEVDPEANKVQIKEAVEKLYNVKVEKVRTAIRQGKPRRAGKKMGRTKMRKRAVVVLHPDHHIDLF